MLLSWGKTRDKSESTWESGMVEAGLGYLGVTISGMHGAYLVCLTQTHTGATQVPLACCGQGLATEVKCATCWPSLGGFPFGLPWTTPSLKLSFSAHRDHLSAFWTVFAFFNSLPSSIQKHFVCRNSPWFLSLQWTPVIFSSRFKKIFFLSFARDISYL
jgi:hypothetical protein